MSIDELVADVLTNYAVAWQSSDGAKCFGIAMELFNLIEQHVAEEVKAETDRCMAACEFMRPSVARGHPVNEAVFAAASVAVDSCIEAIRARADHEEAK